MTELVYEKDPRDFRTYGILGRYLDGNLSLHTVNPEADWDTMQAWRTNKEYNSHLTPESIDNDLRSFNGHFFANMGVSAYPIIYVEGQAYTILVKHERSGDFNDVVAKQISGYLQKNHLFDPSDPLEGMLEEIAEEFIIKDRQGLLVPGSYDGIRIARPFGDEHYKKGYHFQVVGLEDTQARQKYLLPGVVRTEVTLNGKPLAEQPTVFMHSPTNSIQLVYQFHFDIPRILQVGSTLQAVEAMPFRSIESPVLSARDADIDHAEDLLVPEINKLVLTLNPDGLILAKMDEAEEIARLSGDMFYFRKGGLIEIEDKGVLLSEAFVPKENGVSIQDNISIEDYLSL